MATDAGFFSGWLQKLRQGWQRPAEPLDAAETAGTTTGGGSEQEPVVVWEAANRMEAQIVQGRLESEGIPAIIRGEALGTIYGLTTGELAASKVLVPAPLAERARSILAEESAWDEGDDGRADV
ncbi:DUF2007 domain-containing protein [Litorilinea aerophila]|nr:DUF2007 domain-containing protein [Litorilinea aerophila]MCC9078594.1 DUF2007 domain-containing protein [Litorilinea aerophila]OUC06516.1 hypothetical protein RY27_20575 [Litorilinea aerophila]GIV77079.1 MAG: hypothetical protein KatS3mg050_1473 [Litorilinea sp.]